MCVENKIIHILRQRDDGEPESNATGFLLKCKEGIVLVSAAHVADDEELCIATKENDLNSIYALNGTRYKSKMAESRDDDKKDWAIFVNESIMNDLLNSGKTTFETYTTTGKEPFSVSGFPISANKNKHYDSVKVVKNKPYQWNNKEASANTYKSYGYDSNENILVSFDEGYGFYENSPSDKAKFRNPKGMSGAPITDSYGCLIGIFTGITKDKKYLVGTRVETMLNDIKKGEYEKIDIL